uniref:Unkown protein n=1 Tax=Riptortus pedestris TaxID=329032 RepID=R4WRB0_RIPPE|nr:unkown protein [Riptortus pedestris]
MLQRIASPVIRQILRRSNNGNIPSRNAATKVHLRNTMDDLPIPSGSWETHYKAQQAKYNMHLAFGVIFATVTIITAKASGLLNLYSSPPALPKD